MAVAPPVFLDEVVNVLRAFKRSLEAAVAAEVSTRCFPLLVMRGGEGSGKTVYRQALMIALAPHVHGRICFTSLERQLHGDNAVVTVACLFYWAGASIPTPVIVEVFTPDSAQAAAQDANASARQVFVLNLNLQRPSVSVPGAVAALVHALTHDLVEE